MEQDEASRSDGSGKLALIHEFHRERGLDILNGRYQRRDDQDFVRRCFADRTDAEAFKGNFVGEFVG